MFVWRSGGRGSRLWHPLSCSSTHSPPLNQAQSISARSVQHKPQARLSRDSPSSQLSLAEFRGRVAPWVRVEDGCAEDGASTAQLLRALLVFHLCSYDMFVDRHEQIFGWCRKLGSLGEWALRRTFFEQFVGGDSVAVMRTCVQNLRARALRPMVLPVIESDLDDQPLNTPKYEQNVESLEDMLDMTASMGPALFQLKISAVASPVMLEVASRAISDFHGGTSPTSAQEARLVHNLVQALDNPSVLNLRIASPHQTHFLQALARANALVERASGAGVQVLVDAELHSCKPAISLITLALMLLRNKDGPRVGSTTQAYHQDALRDIGREMEVVEEELGLSWFGKVVRGAYMDRERALAVEQGRPSPICPSYETTSESYDRCVKRVLERLSGRPGASSQLVVATHNEKSVRLAAQTMRDLDMEPRDSRVSFAQIYGMADYLSTPLAKEGYSVYKSVPYGPLDSVFPYLGRRACENRAVLQGTREERRMLWKRLRARWLASAFWSGRKE